MMPRIFILLASTLTIIIGFVFFQLPGNTLFWQATQNSGHTFVFAIFTVLSLRILMQTIHDSFISTIIYTSIGLSFIGLFIELAQHATGRGASYEDLAFNLAGIVCGSCTYVLFTSFSQQKRNWINTHIIFIIGVVALAWSLKWPTIYLVADIKRPLLPILANFENQGVQYHVANTGSNHTIAIHSEWLTNPSRSLMVNFKSGRWPSIRFLEPEKDWSRFTEFNFKTYNPSIYPVSISVRIDDRSLGHFDDDHMTITQIIPKGNFNVSLDLELFKADAKRRSRPGQATFKEINSFMVFIHNKEQTTTLYFDDFLLE